jgi:hypothetical protein
MSLQVLYSCGHGRVGGGLLPVRESERDGVAWAQEDRWAGAERVNDLREVTEQRVHQKGQIKFRLNVLH